MQRPLPIDSLLPALLADLERHGSLVLEAPPGAGKTTRVPRAILESGLAGRGEVVVLQPRRLPTRLAARRVAEELGEPLGVRVGYQVRFEDVGGKETRLRFVTEGVLTRRLLSDPRLSGVSAVVLDEFHERHLASDISLALLRALRREHRPELKLLVMSATLEAAPVAAYLGGCPILRSEGRAYPVEIEHLQAPDERHLDQQVLSAVKRLIAAGLEGDLLVFLPGAAEIRRAREALDDYARRNGIELHALHGDLAAAEQDRAVRPSSRRKIILSTNVAETSVTIEGVAAVIDSGLARVASHSPWSGMPVLKLQRVSRASATQRAGRAGRTRAGSCLRLYTRHDFDTRPDHDPPEIRRLDLSETVLSMGALGVPDLGAFELLDPPPPAALEAAQMLLGRLGALDAGGALTGLGRRLLRFPLHPRQARLVVEGERRGVGTQAAVLAALLGERDIRLGARASFGPGGGDPRATSGPSDLLELLERFEEARRGGFDARRVRGLGLDAGATQAVDRVARQLLRWVDKSVSPPPPGAQAEDALMLCALAAFPDRVAKRRRPHSPELLLFGGGAATLAESSVVREPELLVAVDAEERTHGRGGGVVVRLASKVEPEWLLELGASELQESDTLQCIQGRVERSTKLSYGNLVLEETRKPAPPSPEVASVLAEAALSRGLETLADPAELSVLRERLALCAAEAPEADFPTLDDAFLRESLARLCEGARSLQELTGMSLLGALSAQLDSEQRRLLSSCAPERVTLPGGRQLRVHYEPAQPPWIESRLQDFFGLAQGPTVGRSKRPLVLHLLAPNQRAVQVTTDLAGFWARHYPALRKELMRRYPRHAWPEDPLSAQPPAAGGRRSR